MNVSSLRVVRRLPVGADTPENALAAAGTLRCLIGPYAVQQLFGRLPAWVALDQIPHAQFLQLPQEVAGVMPRVGAHKQGCGRMPRVLEDADAAFKELDSAVFAVLASGTQLVGDHEALPPRVAEDGGVSIDIMVGASDALLARRRVLQHGHVDVHGKQLHATRTKRRQAGDGKLGGNARAPFIRAGRQPVQPLPERLLRWDFPSRKLATEDVAPELLYVRVAALARRLDANEAADYVRGRIEGVASRRQQAVPAVHALVVIQQLVDERKTAIRVDFLGTLDKFIHDNLIGEW